jgi:hypothetical protein
MTQATMARPDAPNRTQPPLFLVVLTIAAGLACLAMTYALREPDVVPRVTVENPGSIDVGVDVRSTPGGARLILSNVAPRARTTNLDVADQGDDWIFSFSSGGVDGGTLEMSRAQLAEDDWRIVIPDDVLTRLQTESFVPAYR